MKRKKYILTLPLKNDIREIAMLPDFVEAAVQQSKMDPSFTAALNLALEEAVANVIQYAYPAGASGIIEVDAILDGHSLSFVISDSGKPFDPTAKPDVDITASAEDRPIGGLGIHLVRQIMDTVHYERKDGMNILTITKII